MFLAIQIFKLKVEQNVAKYCHNFLNKILPSPLLGTFISDVTQQKRWWWYGTINVLSIIGEEGRGRICVIS
jgi:hypothetical protein